MKYFDIETIVTLAFKNNFDELFKGYKDEIASGKIKTERDKFCFAFMAGGISVANLLEELTK